jgi:membrane-associated phospholipid phosphatase
MNMLLRYTKLVMELASRKYLFLYIAAVVSTAALVQSGFDWWYLTFVLAHVPQVFLYSADIMGFLIPICVPPLLLLVSFLYKKEALRMYARAMLYAIILSITLSTIVKAFTGRTSPPHHHNGRELVMIDNSRDFHFGFMQEHVIGGWPSGHATLAFALAVTLALMLPPRWYIRAALFAIALFIGIGVTFGFHWFSEFVAGALLGSAIGMVVGTHYIRALVEK